MAASGLLLSPCHGDGFRQAGTGHELECVLPKNKRIKIRASLSAIASHKSLLLKEHNLAQHFRVRNGEILHLELKISDLVTITVKTLSGKKHVLRIPSIFKTENALPLEEQLLTLRGEQLEDGTIIENLLFRGDAFLHLSVHKPCKIKGRDLELVVIACEAPSLYFHEPSFVADTFPAQQATFGEEIIRHYSSLQPIKHFLTVENSETLKDLIEQARRGLLACHGPVLSSEGTGGVYFMSNECGSHHVAVFKPSDEEPMAVNNPRGFASSDSTEGLKGGTRSGEGAIREVAAYLLDHPASRPQRRNDEEGFAGVPPTMMVRCYHEAFHYSSDDRKLKKAKVGSLSKFVNAFSNCEDMGSSSFPVEEVHKISVLDIRLANADRNGGNILVCKKEDKSLKLVPIDHGYCLTDKFEECTFEWLYWPQAQHPYGSSTLTYIASLDAEEDINLLKRYGWTLRPETARVLRISTMLLKKGAAAGLTPFQIGSILSREYPDTKCPIELLFEEAETKQQPASNEEQFLEILSGLVDRYITTLKFL